MEASGQGSGIRLGVIWRDWPRGEMRRGNQRKSKSEDQMTSWAPNVFGPGGP